MLHTHTDIHKHTHNILPGLTMARQLEFVGAVSGAERRTKVLLDGGSGRDEDTVGRCD